VLLLLRLHCRGLEVFSCDFLFVFEAQSRGAAVGCSSDAKEETAMTQSAFRIGAGDTGSLA
jgi:hypothetical protein